MDRSLKVKLLVDLSRYGAGLVPGVEGYTIGQYGIWSRGSDRFVGVRFPGIATLDVLWESIEIIDEEYLAESAVREKQHNEELKSARSVVWHVGPRGGFRYLEYEYLSADRVVNHSAVYSRKRAQELVDVLRGYGVQFETVVDR